jgi:hypothetical protein
VSRPDGRVAPGRHGRARPPPLYEVATGRKILTRTVAGEADCPSFALSGEDKKIYAEVGDRNLYEVLRPQVTK